MFTFLAILEEDFWNCIQCNFKQQGGKSVQNIKTKSTKVSVENIHK